MRRLSKLKIPFSFTFMSCNLSDGKSDGIVEVKKARLLQRQSEKYHKHADIVEKYMDNGGRLFSFRYILDEGNCYPYMLMDTYIADPVNKKCLVSAFSLIFATK